MPTIKTALQILRVFTTRLRNTRQIKWFLGEWTFGKLASDESDQNALMPDLAASTEKSACFFLPEIGIVGKPLDEKVVFINAGHAD